jgi:formylglycine-generating enzyme required for sulfatase activity
MRTSEGTLVVEIDQPDATVQVLNEQGKVIIERKGQKGAMTIGVDPGKRRLRVEKDGFEAFTKQFAIASGGKETIKAKLEPKPGIATTQSVQPSPTAAPGEQPPTSPDKPAERKVVSSSETPPPLAIAPFDAAHARRHQETWAKHLGVQAEITNSIGMKLILIPRGEFMMGSTPEQIAWAMEEGKKDNNMHPWYSNNVSFESPQPRVEITKPFYLGVYEVTQAEYEQVVGSNPSGYKGDVRQPVENVSWFDAVAFCNRLSERERIQPYYKIDFGTVSIVGGNGYRLPTEAEWEYACRAGTTTIWNFGDDESMLGDYAWYIGNSGNKPHKVGEKKPNQWALYDMHGNAWEWCWDWYGRYEGKSVKDPMGRSEREEHRVLRGGTFNESRYLRSAFRAGNPPSTRCLDQMVGFRLARAYHSDAPEQPSSTIAPAVRVAGP